MREQLLAAVAVFLLKSLLATLRVRFEDRCGITRTSPDFPILFTFWHNRILAITKLFQQHYPKGRGGVSVLTSPSRDGEILARIMAAFGMGAVRGSSSRRGATALRECLALIESGRDLAITPDGPRGPRYSLGPGLILLAQQSNARILPLHARFHHAITMKTWDGFQIPLPFSRIDVVADAYQTVPPTPTEEAFNAERQRLEKLLQDGTH
jgi:lysophospholipid acyltransferase (LPLAT)-like uncharacterized protein